MFRKLFKIFKRITTLALLIFGISFAYHLYGLLWFRFVVIEPPKDLRITALTTAGAAIDALFATVNATGQWLEGHPVAGKSKLETIELFVEPGSLAEMGSDPPESAKRRYYSARMRYPDGELRSIRYRFRGRSYWHFNPKKPSLRLRLPDDDPLPLWQSINLINPEDRTMLSNPLGEHLAQELGVVTPVTDFVRLFIDDEYFGVYQRTTKEDDLMLQRNGRIPGPFYVGDHLQRRWQAAHFKMMGTDIGVGMKPIAKLVNAIYSPEGRERVNNIWSVLSKEKFVAWLVAMNLAGGVHTDFVHNNLFYYNSRLEKLEPVVSDINGHGLQTAPKEGERLNVFRGARFDIPLNERMHPLLNVALRDPDFRYMRNKLLYAALKSFGSAENQKKLVMQWYDQMESDVRADYRKSAIELSFVGWYRFAYTNKQYDKAIARLLTWIERREAFLMNELLDTAVSVAIESEDQSAHRVTIGVDGNAGVLFDLQEGVSFVEPVNRKVKGGRLLLLPGLIKYEGVDIFPPTRLNREPQFALQPGLQRYVIKYSGVDINELKSRLKRSFRHAITEEGVDIEFVQDITTPENSAAVLTSLDVKI